MGHTNEIVIGGITHLLDEDVELLNERIQGLTVTGGENFLHNQVGVTSGLRMRRRRWVEEGQRRGRGQEKIEGGKRQRERKRVKEARYVAISVRNRIEDDAALINVSMEVFEVLLVIDALQQKCEGHASVIGGGVWHVRQVPVSGEHRER